MQSSISFSSLKKLGNGTFRLAWFGNIIRGTTSDGVNVVFAPYMVAQSTGEEVCDLSKRISVALPIAYLRKFRIGDIWESGGWTGRRDTQTRETFRLDISHDSTEVMPVGVPVNSNRNNPKYLLPFSDFEGHRDHTHSQCVRIALKDGAMLVIPCMEILRFYFGASGSFLKRLFSGAFALDRLYSDARLNPKTRVASIDLAPDLPGVAAATVARIAFCSQANSAARWIVNSGIANAANQLIYYPKTTFPFFGETNLTAYGRWILHGNSRTFLAEQLSQCTHPFPFDKLYYSTTRSLIKPGMAGKALAKPADNVGTGNGGCSESAISLTDAPISSTLLNMGLPADDDDLCFPDLANKFIRRICKPKPAVGNMKQEISRYELGGGAETSSSTIRGAEIATNLEEIRLDRYPLPDAAAVIERAVRANDTANPGYMVWQSILGQDRYEKGDKTAFAPGNAIVTDNNDRRLQNVWAAVFKVRIDPIAVPVLVLLRDNITEDADDHVVLLRLDPSRVHENVAEYCRLFAAGNQSKAFVDNLLEMIESQRASDLVTILRKLSMVPGKLIRRRFN